MVRRIRSGRKRSPVIGDLSSSTTYYDAFRRRYLPSDETLVREYKRTAYTCANLNACGVASVPFKLYMKTQNGDAKSVLRQGFELRSIPSSEKDELASKPYLTKTLRSFVDIEEVVVHPALDLLSKVNSTQFMNGVRLAELTQLYQEITGKAYWLVTVNLLGVPSAIWLLPSQYIYPVTSSKKVIDHYEYCPPGVNEPIRYSIEDIIPYYMSSLTSPYVEGLSPLEAAYEANDVHNKLLSHEDALLENEARPDAIIKPGKETAFGEAEAERYEKQYRMRFARGKAGGVWVVEDDIDFLPITFPPKDLAKLEINKWAKNDIANAFQIPFALISDASHNRQQLEAAERQHAKHGILPRCNRDAATKNDQFLSRYDDTGRLFFAYDDPIPENREEKLKENIQLGMNGFISPNEVRKNYNYPPIAGEDQLRPINVSSQAARDNARDSGNAEK